MTYAAFTARDDRFHFARNGRRWWATETAWFSFHDPQRRLGGWLYTMVRPNIGTVAGGAWVWDDRAHLPWEALYCANYSALQLPRDQDLDDCHLPNGVSIRVVEPCMRYALGYDDGERLQAQLQFAGVMPTATVDGGRLDVRQRASLRSARPRHRRTRAARRTDRDRLHRHARPHVGRRARKIVRGRRPTSPPRPQDGNGFLAVTNVRDRMATRSRTDFCAATAKRSASPAASGVSNAIRGTAGSRASKSRRAIVTGRRFVAIGEPVSRIILNRHTFIDINSLVRWDLDGVEAWGEDQDMWPVHRWAQFRRDTGGGRDERRLICCCASLRR